MLALNQLWEWTDNLHISKVFLLAGGVDLWTENPAARCHQGSDRESSIVVSWDYQVLMIIAELSSGSLCLNIWEQPQIPHTLVQSRSICRLWWLRVLMVVLFHSVPCDMFCWATRIHSFFLNFGTHALHTFICCHNLNIPSNYLVTP
jgi:hypothetical protein